MTGPTGADQRRPGDLDVDQLIASDPELAAQVERIQREQLGHPDSPPPPGR